MKKNIVVLLLCFATSAFAKANSGALAYVGSCAWGNTSIASCTHKAGNALVSFYVSADGKNVFAFNRVTMTNENYCVAPTTPPEISKLRAASGGPSGFAWLDEGATKISHLTVVGTLLNKVQLSTGSFNFKQLSTGHSMTAYAPCFLVKTLH